jgi:histidinol-phosphatase
MNADFKSRYDLAIRTAQEAGRLALKYFPDIDSAAFADQVIWKSDNSPVTIADRSAEQLLRDMLLAAYPDDGFLGEEFGDRAGTSGYRWIVDPIDGTRNFVRGIPHWATLVGLEYHNEVIAGVAVEPVPNMTYRALRGDGAYRNDRRIHVSPVNRLEDSTMFYSSLSWFMRAGKQDEFIKLAKRAQRQRGFGDYYGHILVAQGSGEFMVEHGLHAWDVAAIKPIVEEAGGRFSNWAGETSIHAPDCVTSNGVLHELVLAILRGGA